MPLSVDIFEATKLDKWKASIREAIAFHLEGLRKDRQSIPEPTSLVEYMFI
ncbi:MAG: hypothetical protein VST70_05180 [Nitrospirota bacterium]|nr:hypothetical protein [Nitrospirota bacterium]